MALTRNYFQKFPSISYNDYVVRDISVRAKLTQYLTESGLALLPYTIKEGERADNIASFYYEDPYYAWAIYLVNGIIDPYSEWPKDSNTLDRYIEEKYGSIEAARDTILRYEVDWASDTSLISPETYNALPQTNKKYWAPQYGYNREVISYFRQQLDWTLDNNRLDQIVVIANSSVNTLSNSFSIGERLYQYNYLNDVAVKSTVVSVDSTTRANTRNFLYTNSTFFDINFSTGNTIVFVKSTSRILPKARISGTNIPADAYVERIISGTRFEISDAPTGAPASNSTYAFSNPASATLTVQKVDFSDVTFAVDGSEGAANSFFVYNYKDSTTGQFTNGSPNVASVSTSLLTEGQGIDIWNGVNLFSTSIASITNSTHMVLTDNASFTGSRVIYYGEGREYRDLNNYLVGRTNGANVVVLTHSRLDANVSSDALLANSRLSIDELVYWKPVNAYDDEIAKNELRKEIFVLDANFIGSLDDNLEAIVKNV